MYDVYTIALGDPHYPALLNEITNPPEVLYVRGTLPTGPCVAVVGTRRNTRYGQQVTDEFSSQLARAGVCIVSGLALGVDGFAHEAALAVGGTTVAVLGTGIDEHTIYPTSHRGLAERILEHGGALVSEYPPGFKATAYSFPERNRIIAGLSLGTLVTEAPHQSGALITAYHAVHNNRDVFAIPHAITSPNGYGCNSLIVNGALLVTHPNAILEALNLNSSASENVQPSLTKDEERIYKHLTKEACHIDALIAASGARGDFVMSMLTILEMRGLVKHLGGMLYIKNQWYISLVLKT